VRIELTACGVELRSPKIGNVKGGVAGYIPLEHQRGLRTSSTVALFNQAVVDGFDGSAAWPSYTVGGNTLQATRRGHRYRGARHRG